MKTHVRVSCFYGEATPGSIVMVDSVEAKRLETVGAGKIVAPPVEEATPEPPKAPKGPKATA